MIQLKDIYSICIDKKFPLAVYQYPGDNQFQYIIQLSNLKKLNDGEDITSMKGFAFVPFNQPYPLPSYVIEPDIMNRDRSYDSSILQLLNQSKALTPDAYVSDIPYMASQEEYSDHVTEIITHIKNGKFQKAILSRTLIEKRPDFLNHTDLFLKMCKRYHSSFISMVYIPGYSTWIGASPELLFSQFNKQITLVSLAGTQVRRTGNLTRIVWDEKEKMEQSIVTDYFTNVFSEFNILNYDRNGPYTVEAGDMVHLKTTFTLPEDKMNGHTDEFIKRLHPTPAVWGQPKTDALNIITTLEKYHREHYTGYLGPVNINGRTDLYVNLRTLKAVDDKIIIYVGSGITEGSNPLNEWEETCMKAQTVLSIIHSF